jgi:hypothetical protein
LAKLDLDRASVDGFAARFRAIHADTPRLWGSMAPELMMQHVLYMVELSLGERKPEKLFVPIPRFITWTLFFNWFTNWPKGKIKAPPSFFPTPEGDVEKVRNELLSGLYRFVDALDAKPGQTGFTPLLGDINLQKWARVHGVHMDHHLRQFGA